MKIKDHLLCRKCGADWKHTKQTRLAQCPFCGAEKDARDRSEEFSKYVNAAKRKRSMIKWNADKKNRQARGRWYTALVRKRVFFKICGSISPICIRCGCDDRRLLEVNHKAGGGNQEMMHGKRSGAFYRAIANGKRKTDDLELLCKPCNAIHALEMKYGPLPIRVVWK